MTQSHYSILFSSNTGNTKLLAEAIRKALPAAYCDFFGDCAENVVSTVHISYLLFISSWEHFSLIE